MNFKILYVKKFVVYSSSSFIFCISTSASSRVSLFLSIFFSFLAALSFSIITFLSKTFIGVLLILLFKGEKTSLGFVLNTIKKFTIRLFGLLVYVIIIWVVWLLAETLVLKGILKFDIDASQLANLTVHPEFNMHALISYINGLILFPIVIYAQVILLYEDCYVYEAFKEGYVFFLKNLFISLILAIVVFERSVPIVLYNKINNSNSNEFLVINLFLKSTFSYFYLLSILIAANLYHTQGRSLYFVSIKPLMKKIKEIKSLENEEAISKIEMILKENKHPKIKFMCNRFLEQIKR